MATVNSQVQPIAPVAVPAAAHEVPEMRIYSHSALFYWWPVWVFGFLFALITRLVQIVAFQPHPHTIVVAMRVLALAAVVPQIVARREGIFHRDLEHRLNCKAGE